jgi:hypothetical protein
MPNPDACHGRGFDTAHRGVADSVVDGVKSRLRTGGLRFKSPFTLMFASPLRFPRLWIALLWVIAGWLTSMSVAGAEPAPVRVENIRRVFHNGEHNAFTDLVRWRNKFWLAFRSCPDGHMNFVTGSVIVLVSDDAKTWKQVHRFSVADRDTRDPHFLVFKDKLFIYTGTALVVKGGKGQTDWVSHFGYAVWTSDGETWSKPKALEGTYGHYIWRAAAFGDTAYLCARRWRDQVQTASADRETMEAALLESDDGLRWRFRSFLQEKAGNETAFIFEPDGTLVSVSRATMKKSETARSRPPYNAWERHEIPEYLGGPILAQWGDRLIVGARKMKPEGPRTTFSWLEGTKLVPCAELPSDGDNSYPGFVALDARRALISWYSSHEKDAQGKAITAIYMAELVRTD